MSRPRVVVVAAAAATLALAGCSSGPSPELPPDRAVTELTGRMGLSTDQQQCLTRRFTDDPGAAAVLNVDTKPSDGQRGAFLDAMRTCVPIAAFATTLGVTLRDQVEGSTDAQVECVRQQITGLAAADQDRLYLFFANPALLDVTEVGPVTSRIAEACGLEAPPATTPGAAPGSSAVPAPTPG